MTLHDNDLYTYHTQKVQQLLPHHAAYNFADDWKDSHTLLHFVHG
jgi:hypothetical protein